jgi:hypothetical protein
MNKKTTYIIVAVLVIIIVVGIAAYALLYNSGGGGTTSPTPTPTVGVADATTLQFSANVTSQGQTTEYKWYGKNIHSSNLTIRVDFANYVYIMDASQEKSWSSTDSGATWTQGNFTADWISWSPLWTDYVDNLAHWSGSGNYAYTDSSGEAITLFNISVNPTIPDSTFTAS